MRMLNLDVAYFHLGLRQPIVVVMSTFQFSASNSALREAVLLRHIRRSIRLQDLYCAKHEHNLFLLLLDKLPHCFLVCIQN